MKRNKLTWLLAISSLILLLVACTPPAPTTGSVKVTVSGIPSGQNASVSLTKGTATNLPAFTADGEKTVDALEPGDYAVSAQDITTNGITYKGSANPASVKVEAGKTVSTAVSFAASDGKLTVTISGLPTGTNASVTVAKQGGGFSQTLTATTTLSGLSPGTYTLTPANVIAGGFTYSAAASTANVTAGNTAAAAVNYSTNSGKLSITTAGLPSGTNPNITVTGPGGFSQTVTTTPATLENLTPGSYTVTPISVTTAGTTYSAAAQNGIAVTAGQTATANVNYSAATGSLQVNISGLPNGANASVLVSGPNGFSTTLSATQTIPNLIPGSYTVSASNVTNGGFTYAGTVTGSPATVTAGGTASSSVNYAASSGRLSITTSGVPVGANPNLTVTGPGGFNQAVTTTPATLENLTPGSYAISPNNISSDGFTYAGTPTGSPATVVAGGTASASVNYAAIDGKLTLNLSGLPTTATTSVTLTGPLTLTATRTVSFAAGQTSQTVTLPVGTYSIGTNAVFVGTVVDELYTASASAPTVTVVAATTAGPVTISHTKRVGTGQLFASGTTVNQSLGVFSFSDATLAAGSGSSSNTIDIGSLDQPLGLVFDKAGNLYIVSQINKTISRIAAADLTSGSPTPNLVISTATSGDLNGPEYAAFDSQGNLWVTSPNNERLVKFSAAQLTLSGPQDLTPAAIVTTTGSFLDVVVGIAIDGSDNVYVSAFTPNQVTKIPASALTGSGAIALTAGQVTTLSGLSGPAGLAIDAGGRLWVANYAANNIVRVKADFSGTDATLTDSRTSPATMTKPNNLAFDKQGKLWVATDNGVGTGPATQGEVLRFDPDQTAQVPSAVLNVTGSGTGLAFNVHAAGLALNGRP